MRTKYCTHIAGFCVVLILALVTAGCGKKKAEDAQPSPEKGIPATTVALSEPLSSAEEKQKTVEAGQPAAHEPVTHTSVLGTIAEGENPILPAPKGHAAAAPSYEIAFGEQGRGIAYVAEKAGKTYVVHNGKRGKAYKNVGGLTLSPDGTRVVYSALGRDDTWRMVTGMRGDRVFYHFGNPVFSPDSRHVAYPASIKDKWHLVIDDKVSKATDHEYEMPVFSADSKKIAYAENLDDTNKRLYISDLGFSKQTVMDSIVGPVRVNGKNTRIAAVQKKDGKARVISFSFDRPDVVTKGPQYDDIDMPVFGNDGVSLCYVAVRAGEYFMVMDGREERLPGGSPAQLPVERPDRKGVGLIMSHGDGFFLHQAFYNDGTKAKKYEEAAELTYNKDGSAHVYVARKGSNWFIVANETEGPAFDRVVSPMFSPDGSKIVYRARKDGKRFVVVADRAGKTIMKHAEYELVFPLSFTADGKSVAYGVKNGRKLVWKVEKL